MQNRRFAQSPIDALIDLVIGGRLCCQVPVRLDLDTLVDLQERWGLNTVRLAICHLRKHVPSRQRKRRQDLWMKDLQPIEREGRVMARIG